MKPRCIVPVCVLLGVLLSGARLSQAQYRFVTIDYPEASETVILGINNLGVVVGEYGDIDFTREGNGGNSGFIYDGTTFTSLRVPNSFSTAATGINDQGIVVGSYLDRTGKQQGFWFDGMTYHTLTVPDAQHVSPEDINNQGFIVGGLSSTTPLESLSGFRCQLGGLCETFDFPGGTITIISGNNDGGDEVGVSLDADSASGFLLPQFVAVSYPDAPTTSFTGIADNRIASGVRTTLEISENFEFLATNHGFLYDVVAKSFLDVSLPGECGFDPFQDAGVCQRSLEDVNSSGTVVGYFDSNDGQYHGFIGMSRLPGDFDENGRLDAADIDSLTMAVRALSTDSVYDLSLNQTVDLADHTMWVVELKRTWFGDANLDGAFDTADLVDVFQAGEYEDTLMENTGWAEGDWNGDLEFTSGDLVAAFSDGGFEQGNRGVALVPEPPTAITLVFGGLLLPWRLRARSRSLRAPRHV